MGQKNKNKTKHAIRQINRINVAPKCQYKINKIIVILAAIRPPYIIYQTMVAVERIKGLFLQYTGQVKIDEVIVFICECFQLSQLSNAMQRVGGTVTNVIIKSSSLCLRFINTVDVVVIMHNTHNFEIVKPAAVHFSSDIQSIAFKAMQGQEEKHTNNPCPKKHISLHNRGGVVAPIRILQYKNDHVIICMHTQLRANT